MAVVKLNYYEANHESKLILLLGQLSCACTNYLLKFSIGTGTER